MAYTYSCTGLRDTITALEIGEFDIEVTFNVHGSFKVNLIMNREAYNALKEMEVGQKVSVATNRGKLMWVKPK